MQFSFLLHFEYASGAPALLSSMEKNKHTKLICKKYLGFLKNEEKLKFFQVQNNWFDLSRFKSRLIMLKNSENWSLI